MSWSLLLPNLLIGLREGFEAGLIVTILLGAVRRIAPERSVVSIWLGVAAAAAVSLSFGAVLTLTRAELSPGAQEGFAGVLSLVAVLLVTWMVFWMRGAARQVSGDLRGKVSSALRGGGGALAVTAFVAVAREGLETALFVWTNAQAAGESPAPLTGAVLGLVLAAALCVLLYRRVVKINLSRFFKVTGAILVVIVAGVLAYGVGELQGTGLLPGRGMVAFDVSGQVSNASWWAQALRGVLNIDTRMTLLQVLAYAGYLVVTMSLFLAAGPAPVPATSAARPVQGTTAGVDGAESARVGGVRSPAGRRAVAAIAAAVVLPVTAAAVWVAVDRRPAAASGVVPIELSQGRCAANWPAPSESTSVYLVSNRGSRVADVELVQTGTGAVAAEIEILGPGTSRQLSVSLPAGEYLWQCRYDGGTVTVSTARTVTRSMPGSRGRALVPATAESLAPALVAYRAYVGGQLKLLNRQVAALQRQIVKGDRAAAQRDWLRAHLTYRRIGAAYDAFGDEGAAVDGLAQGLPGGTRDPNFQGLHRIELGLWSARPLQQIAPAGAALTRAVSNLEPKLAEFTFDPNDVTIRAHEILEDTLRFTLTGQDDYGSGSGFATARADLDGTRTLIRLLAPLLDPRSPGLTEAITTQMTTLQTAIQAANTAPVATSPLSVRQHVNAATSRLLETLASIPELLEVKAQ